MADKTSGNATPAKRPKPSKGASPDDIDLYNQDDDEEPERPRPGSQL